MSAEILSHFDQADGMTGAEMLNINDSAGVKCQHAVAGNEDILCDSRRTADAKFIGDSSMVDAIVCDQSRVFLMETQRNV